MVEAGYQPFSLNNDSNSIALTKDDVLVLQFPLLWHSLKKQILTRFLKIGHSKLIYWFMISSPWETKKSGHLQILNIPLSIFLQNKTVLEKVDGIIAHNEKMKSELVRLGIPEEKIVSLEIFDYLIPNYEEKKAYEKKLFC